MALAVATIQLSYAAQPTRRKLNQDSGGSVAATRGATYSQGDPVLHAIFISYRREDSEGEAGRLADDLAKTFQEESVFMDVNAIQPGRDFRKAIDESIHKCSVLLAIVGQSWLESRDTSGQRRLDDENDFVRIEIASALERDITVIPVLVRGAKMPRAEQLPKDLRELAFRNAVELTHARWRSDVQVLIQALRPCLESTGERILSGDTVNSRATVRVPKTVVGATGPLNPVSIDRPVLERISRELAIYIGPIAEVVVRRAAKRCTSVRDLIGMVAQEIESSTDRARFLASCGR
jgi:hypothetical protein